MTMNIHSISSNVPVSPLDIGEAGTSTRSPEAGGATTLLPEPMTVLAGADMAAQITALAVKAGQEQQDIDTKSTEAEDAVQDQADQAEVATMHEEASTIRAGAWESGILQISAGACTIASAAESVGANAGSKAAGIATGLKGSADILNGAATLAGGLSKAAGTDLEAQAAGSKALADAAERSGATARDSRKDASAFVQAAIDFYREYQSTKAQSEAAAVHAA